MPSYHIWTIGCQMNKADSERLAAELEGLGYQNTEDFRRADVIVLNSCVVRQSAEDRVVGVLGSLKAIKRAHPERVVALVGCMVGPRSDELKRRFPHVDVFCRPQAFVPLLDQLRARQPLLTLDHLGEFHPWAVAARVRGQVSAFVPVIQGCDKFCTYCIVPYRRGREKSRPIPQVVAQVSSLVGQGVKEVSLLGQTVDSYGHDLPDQPDLADLLRALNAIEGLIRIRFLTSYPPDMTERIIEAVATLDRVCEHFNVPLQSGDDDILRSMRRGYTVEAYRALIASIRHLVPHVGLSTDVIVGYPGETEAQFLKTYQLLEELRFDTVHVAAYSQRPGTIASRTLADDVPREEKRARLQAIESLQERISAQINAGYQHRTVEILVEGQKKGQWQGRTRDNKLVFFSDGAERDYRGQLLRVTIQHTSAWSLKGSLCSPPQRMPLGDLAPVVSR